MRTKLLAAAIALTVAGASFAAWAQCRYGQSYVCKNYGNQVICQCR